MSGGADLSAGPALTDADAFDCFYVLDGDDRILDWGGAAWEAFAQANAAPDVAVRDFRGERLWDHVAGHFTQQFLRVFFAKARAAPAGLSRTYRCDSPRVKRLMEMRTRVREDGALYVGHRLIGEATMPVEVATQEAGDARLAQHLRCSLCNRLSLRGQCDWREPETFARGATPLPVIHTVCEDCRRGVAARLPNRATPGGSRRPAAPPSSS